MRYSRMWWEIFKADNDYWDVGNIPKVQIVKEPPKFQAQCLGCFIKFSK